MYLTLLEMGSMVLDINGNRLDAKFLRETGAIEDHFTIIKGGATEPFRLCTLELNGFEVIARWKSEPGHDYIVEQATSLAPPNWLPFSDPIRAYGATTSWTNYVDSTEQAFYRVQQLQ